MDSENRAAVPVRVDKCVYCSSANMVRHVKIDQTADAGRIGLAYHTRFLIIGTEPLFADLCDDCGSIARIFIDTPARKWVTK
jgi:hypothetical protein